MDCAAIEYLVSTATFPGIITENLGEIRNFCCVWHDFCSDPAASSWKLLSKSELNLSFCANYIKKSLKFFLLDPRKWRLQYSTWGAIFGSIKSNKNEKINDAIREKGKKNSIKVKRTLNKFT